ncbi:hypothetical protein BDZ94DRAFT_65674 [Collybia nuda]|uniref:Uncharacterized protein n=1 Tax=Collybia nuda TaxID=64659 RepID=A0A9P6CFB6_9AGAR|nr:hypothetical protein BDZ94DRAFT_65674 [Collybia nuda]
MGSLLSCIVRAFIITWTTIRLFFCNCVRPKSSNISPTVAQPVHPLTPIHRPHFIPFTAPYLCATSPYDHDPSGFWDFPTRVGWALDPTGYSKYRNEQEIMDWEKDLAPLDARYGCRRRKAPESLSRERPRDALRLKCYRMGGGDGRYQLAELSEQVAFLQAWLFFELLAQVSSICGVSVRLEDEFVLPGRQVSIAALERLMQTWLDVNLNIEQVTQIVQVIQHVLSMQTRFEDLRKKESQALTSTECKVLFSIKVAIRSVLLTLALSGVCESTIIRSLMDPQIQEYYPAYWDELKDFARDELLHKG